MGYRPASRLVWQVFLLPFSLSVRADVGLDGINITLPYHDDLGSRGEPWPHVDQSPLKRYKHCIQGIVNLVSPHSIVLRGTRAESSRPLTAPKTADS